jgi:hypothetical protein
MTYIKLFESWLNSQLTEAALPVSTLTFNTAQISADIDKENEETAALKDAVLQKFNEYNIIFDDKVDRDEAAWLVADNISFGPYPVKPTEILMQMPQPITVNTSPADPSKILTHGEIKSDRIISPTNVNGASTYDDIVKFMNTYTIYSLITGGTKNGYVSSVSVTGAADANGSFVLSVSGGNTMRFYGKTKTSAAQSKQEVKTTSWTIPAEGKALVKTLPGTMFATGQVTLANSAELDKAIAELTALVADKTNKITSITIESSASGDRGVNGVSGYPANTPAGKYPMGQPYLPKTAQESGNAQLAFGRAETIKAKLAAFGPATVKAMIQDGGDAAQYAKLIVNIEKTDKPAQTLTKQELENILLKKSEVSDLQSVNTIQPVSFKR